MFCTPELVSTVPRVPRPIFMFCALRLIFDGSKGVGSCFHVLRLDSFSTVTRASGPIFMFCATGHVFSGPEGDVSRFHVLCAETSFWRYQGRRVLFSCFALTDTFSAVRRASGLDFIFCSPEHVFGGTEGVGSRFNIIRSLTRFRRYCGHRVPFSYFALPVSFSAVPRASSPVFMFYANRQFFDDTGGVGFRIHLLRSRTCFRRYRGRQLPFSCFACPDSFSAVPRASGPILMFCAPGLFSAVPRASGPVFMFCAPGHFFGCVECVGSRFHILRARTHIRRSRGRRVVFSCFACRD
jgi:hypothetical protein